MTVRRVFLTYDRKPGNIVNIICHQCYLLINLCLAAYKWGAKSGQFAKNVVSTCLIRNRIKLECVRRIKCRHRTIRIPKKKYFSGPFRVIGMRLNFWAMIEFFSNDYYLFINVNYYYLWMLACQTRRMWPWVRQTVPSE